MGILNGTHIHRKGTYGLGRSANWTYKKKTNLKLISTSFQTFHQLLFYSTKYFNILEMSELISAGVGPFGNAQDPDIVPCAVCGDPVQHVDKFMVEREIIHKSCFICAFCDARLQVGYCVQELALYNRYGPCWYCSLICAHRPLAEKEAKLKENGVEVRQPSTRRPKAKSGQSAGINMSLAGAIPNAQAVVNPAEADAQKAPENPSMEVENVATLEGEIGKEVEGKGIGNDGPEIEAEEIEAQEMPKKVEENGQMAAEVAAPEQVPEVVEASKNEGEGGEVMQGDGEEMEAEEVVKTTEAKEPTPPKSEEENNDSQQCVNSEAIGPIEGGEIGQQEQKMASAEGEEVAPPATPTKESKPVAMDAYENKYRLQMKKKK